MSGKVVPTDVREPLLHWFDAHKRALPWRADRDPYRVWVSEIMCQQTRVDTVIPYFERWMAELPTLEHLAGCSDDVLMGLWQGLGYYSRARNLRKAAQTLTNETLPSNYADLLKLPGIGPYTAGAIASICFDEVVPAVDGNAIRVLTRLHAIRDDVAKSSTRNAVHAIATAAVEPTRPGDFNQALMELGALICTPRSAKCDICPLAGRCVAKQKALVDEIPFKSKKTKVRNETWTALIIRRPDGRLLVSKRGPGAVLEGLWMLPTYNEADIDPAAAVLGIAVTRQVAEVAHVFSHIRAHVHVVEATTSTVIECVAPGHVEQRWVNDADLAALPASTLMRKLCVAANLC